MFCSRSVGRGGVTLVEMMIAMIITLMIVFAMVQAFASIGETTTDGRAVIEMLGQMRQARVLLEEDISRCTIPVAMRDPRVLQPDQYHGYYELVEGPAVDSIPLGANVSRCLVRTPTGLLYSNLSFADPADATANVNDRLAGEWRTLFGDLDDILCLTIRNDESPFRGRMAYPGTDGNWNTADDFTTIIESNLAEVVWWAELNDQPRDEDTNNNNVIDPPVDSNNDGFIDGPGEGGYGVWDPGETFTIRRRVLLIRPDLVVPGPPLAMNIPQFLVRSDLSVHYHYDATTQAYMGLKANSLGDLTFRWNRVAHIPINGDSATFPPANANAQGLTAFGTLSPIDPSALPAFQSASMRGEDVVLSNVMGFDFRVWDPNVPVCGYTPLNGELPEGLVPGDPGYAGGVTPVGTPAYVTAVTNSTEGYGAFVDLGSLDLRRNGVDDDGMNGIDDPGEATLNPLSAQFLSGMQVRSYLPANNYVYDPWTLRYETDTYDEDSDATADEGGETFPPYPYPLKVLQVRIRMYESDTRQVKQVSQNIEFAK